jgi:hypothetical protein
MKNVSHFDEFLNEGMTPDTNITVRTPKYSGPVRFPSMVEYLALSTKYANDSNTNFGQAKKVMLLKKKSKSGFTESMRMLTLFKEILADVKIADPSAYSKIGGDTLVKKLQMYDELPDVKDLIDPRYKGYSSKDMPEDDTVADPLNPRKIMKVPRRN